MRRPLRRLAWRSATPRWRAAIATLGIALSSLCMASSGSTQAAGIPASLQAELLAKLQNYDRSFAARAGDTARILLVVKADSAKSALSANEMKSALSRVERIGGLHHQETMVTYIGAAELAQRCRADRVAIVFVAAELEDSIEAISAALSSVSVLSVGALPSYVAKGLVLGFELESGKPKIIFNLKQARRQNVDFSSTVLRLMRVYR